MVNELKDIVSYYYSIFVAFGTFLGPRNNWYYTNAGTKIWRNENSNFWEIPECWDE